MKPTYHHIAATVLLATVACSDTTGPPDLHDLTGSWNAVTFELTDTQSGEKADLLADGFEFSMRITKQGGITFITREPGEAVADTSTGTIRLSGSQVTITVEGDTMTGTAALVAKTLTLDFPAVEFFDTMLRMLMVFRKA